MGDVEVEALVNTLYHSLAEVEAETPGDTLRDVLMTWKLFAFMKAILPFKKMFVTNYKTF